MPGSLRYGAMLALVLSILLGTFATGSAQEKPDFKLVDHEVKLNAAGGGRDSLLLNVKGLESSATGTLTVVDLGIPSRPDITISFEPKEMPASDDVRTWVLIANVEGGSSDTSQERYLSVKIGSVSTTLEYTLTHDTPPAFVWTVKPPPEQSLRPGQRIEVGVSVLGRPATNVRLLQAVFIEDGSKTLVDGGWILCAAPSGYCSPDRPISLVGSSISRLWLRPAADVIGKFTGTVILAATEDPDGEAFTMTLYGTTWWHQAIGVGVIFVGVAVAWVASTWSQNAINRRQLLRPVMALASRATALGARLDRLREPISEHLEGTRRKLATLDANKMIGELQNGNMLPGIIPLPRATMESSTEAYQKFLVDRVDLFNLLDMLIDAGFEEADGVLPDPLLPVHKTAVAKAAEDLDKLSGSENIKDVADEVAAILTTLGAALNPGPTRSAKSRAAPVPPSAGELTVEINRLSCFVWSIFGLLATALGSYVVVFTNPGFGLPADFLFCLFWGFGLPSSAQQLAQATVSSAGTALGVPIPKPS